MFDADFVLEHMIHEGGVLKLEVGELEAGDDVVADEDFACLGWFLLDGVFKVVIAVFFIGGDVEEILEGGFVGLGWDDFNGWIFVLQELEDFLVCSEKVEGSLGGRNDEFDLDWGGKALNF